MIRNGIRFIGRTITLTFLICVSAAGSNEVVIVGLNSNRVLTGMAEIPVEFHATNSDDIGVHFLLDGEPSMSIINPDPPPKSPIVGHWCTTYVSNGWHGLQAFGSYPDPAMSSAGGYNTYSSQVVRVQTFNPIVLPDFPTIFGNADTGVPFAFPIRAFLASTNATWKVTISTLSNQVLRVLSGTTTNGFIETFWDGKDSAGTRVKPEAIQIDVETASTDGESKASRISQRVWAQGHSPSAP